jgi:hypothetical protein
MDLCKEESPEDLKLEPAAEDDPRAMGALISAIQESSGKLSNKGKQIDSRRLFLFTYQDRPGDSDPSVYMRVFDDAQGRGIVLELWHFSRPGHPFRLEAFYDRVLHNNRGGGEGTYEEEGAEARQLDCSGPLDDLRQQADRKLLRKRRLSRVPLVVSQDPPFSLDVGLYKTVQPMRKPTPTTLERSTNLKLATKTDYLHPALGNVVRKEDAATCADFLGQMLPVDKEDFGTSCSIGVTKKQQAGEGCGAIGVTKKQQAGEGCGAIGVTKKQQGEWCGAPTPTLLWAIVTN